MMKILYSLLFFVSSISGFAQSMENVLLNNNCAINARINQYDPDRYNMLMERKRVELNSDNKTLDFQSSKWQITRQVSPLEKPGKYKIDVTFKCLSGKVDNASVSVDLDFSGWSKENYVLMPGAVYNGNRYEAIVMNYMPFWYDTTQVGINKPILLSDQPRLNYRDGFSRIQERSGSMSIPGVGFRSARLLTGFWMCFQQAGDFGDYGVDIEENKYRDKATITLTSPVVREVRRHWLARMDVEPSTDQTVNFKAGDKTTVSLIIDFFNAPRIQSLFDELADIRVKDYPAPLKNKLIPFSEAFKIMERKFNRENWRKGGYYAVGTREWMFDGWQIGWVGGMMTTLPLLAEGSELSKERVFSNFDWLFPQGISPSGYYYDLGFDGKFYGAFPQKALGKDLHLVRKNADATYYIFKQFDLMKKLKITVKSEWKTGNFKALDAQIKTWVKYGQLGQFVNQQTGDLYIGNTSSAGIFPASLCAAYKQSGNAKYLKTAEDIANYFYKNFIEKGIVCGGPGDAMQSFDSESAYGLLEGLVELYEVTQNRDWLLKAEDAAKQFSAWIVAYDYKFPPGSTYGKLDIRSTGTVYANSQNKTSCGGICTHSGIALLKLYRATQNSFYIRLLADIAHTIPQFMSFKGHEIPGYHEGWISERNNMNDWLEGIGETMAASTWAETSLLLTIVELPGIYVNLDTKEVFEIDHIKGKLLKNGSLEITNPTVYDAVVKVLVENKGQMQKPLGQNAFLNWKKVEIPAGKTIVVSIKSLNL